MDLLIKFITTQSFQFQTIFVANERVVSFNVSNELNAVLRKQKGTFSLLRYQRWYQKWNSGKLQRSTEQSLILSSKAPPEYVIGKSR